MTILTHLLLNNPAAPLRQELLRSGIGNDVLGEWNDEILQPTLSITIKNSNESLAADFQTIVQETLTRLAKDGLDPALVEASINLTEFKLREADYGSLPKGLVYNIAALTSWLYDGDPVTALHFEPHLQRIRQQASQGYFESLIKKYLLANPHSCLLILRPEPGLDAKRERLLTEKLAEQKAEFSTEDLEAIIAADKNLKETQASPDTEEALLKIPMLGKSDINPHQEMIPSEQKEVEGLSVLYQPLVTNGIAYLSLYFDTFGIDAELLPYLGLLSRLLGKLDTAKRSYTELAQEVNRHTGGINFPIECFTACDSADNFKARFTAKSKILANKFPELFSLLGEILFTTDFRNKQRLHEVIREVKSRYEMQFSSRGSEITRRRLLSYFSPSEHYHELTSGIAFYRFITDIDKKFDTCYEEVQSKLKALLAQLFSTQGLVIGLTTTEDIYSKFALQFMDFAGKLPAADHQPVAEPTLPVCQQEGFILPGSQVQYVACGSNFRRAGYDYHGSMEVLSSVVSLDYLWNRVRVQGGAYGSGIGMRRNGDLWFTSYRDPHLQRTLDVYREVAGYLRTFAASEREMMKYLIGTIANLDAYFTPSQKGEIALRRYFSGITHEDIQREREQILTTKITDLHNYADMLEAVIANACICAIGSESKINERRQLFKKVERLIE